MERSGRERVLYSLEGEDWEGGERTGIHACRFIFKGVL